MLNADIYQNPPREFELQNNGVAKVSEGQTAEELRTLQYELKTFVCEGKYEEGMLRLLRTYLADLGKSEQKAGWVSGFFGSGKSHLVKVLRHLWVDTAFDGGVTARGMTSRGALPVDVTDQLRELSQAGLRHAGLHAASGTLGASANDSVRLALLAIVFRSVGLPEDYARARFVLRLMREGKFEAFNAAVERAGASLYGDGSDLGEIYDLHVSGVIAQAVLESGVGWGSDEKEVRAAIRAEFTEPDDISNEAMLRSMREALALATPQATPDDLPCTLIALDEVQQYIGSDERRSEQVQLAVEACSEGLGSRVFIVGTGQNALQSVPLLKRLEGRFRIKVQLSDADVKTVTRKTVLAKTNAAVPDVKAALDGARGELSRHLKDTLLKQVDGDLDVEVADYPVLPSRRRFWDRVLQSTDTSGTESQLRNQLKIVDEAVKATADAPLGTVVGGDFVYDRESLLQAGELPAEIDTRIERLRAEGDPLDARVAALAWMIGRLSRESGSDTGLRATPEQMADLLVEDLTASSTGFRGRVADRLTALYEAGELMHVEGEYRIQTTQSAEWDRAFRSAQTALLNDVPKLATERNDVLRTRVLKTLDPLRKIKHGTSNTPRQLEAEYGGSTAPKSNGNGVPVWIRTGWDVGIETVRDDARAAGAESPLVLVYLPNRGAEALHKALTTFKAAQDTLHTKGMPAEAEGRDARKAIETRRDAGEREVGIALDDVLKGAQVFLAGGADVSGETLAQAVETAAQNALARLFPEFDVADDLRWSKVFERAKQGSTAALEAVDYRGAPAENPVCADVLRFVGAGKTGAEVRARFESAPYGWPPDTVSGALAVLVLHGLVNATKDGQAVEAKGLDTRGIAGVRFQAEDVVLTFNERIAIAQLYKNADVQAKPNEIAGSVREFVTALRAMATRAGGDAPFPAVPQPPVLDEILGLTGNAQLRRLHEERNSLNALMSDWGSLSARRSGRQAEWDRLRRALGHADGLPEATSVRSETDAIREQRTLLADASPLDGLADRLFGALRTALTDSRASYASAHDREREALETDAAWQALDASQRAFILGRYDIDAVPAIDVATPDAILGSLDTMSLATWRNRTEGLSTRFKSALTDAVRETAEDDAPPVRSVRLRSATLRSAGEVEAWLAETRTRLLAEVAQGPIVL